MTVAEKTAIEDLADQGWKAARIAQRLNRHPGTVSHHMTVNGFRLVIMRPLKPYVRNGSTVVSFTKVEDTFIEERALAGLKNRQICAEIYRRFGHTRSPHTIAYRLRMIAATAEFEAEHAA
jgi:IS30 family transposase